MLTAIADQGGAKPSSLPRRKLRVLVVTGTSLGGSATYIQHLIEGLGAEVEFALVYGSGSPQDHRFESLPCRRCSLPMASRAGIRDILDLTRAVERQITTWDPDVIHTNTTAGGLAGRWAARRFGASGRVVHTLHAFGSHDLVPANRRWAIRLLERVLDRWTGVYVCVSEHMQRYGRSHRIFTLPNQIVIHNTIGRYPTHGVDARRRSSRSALGLGDDAMLAVFAGRLERQKGVEVLIDALTSDRCAGIHLAVCGSGSLEPALAARAVAAGISDRIHFLGWRDDTRDWIAGADLVVLPSRWESFGLVNLEAMAWAIPICASAVDGIPEVVADGRCGILVPPEDSAALAEAVGSLMADRDRRRCMGAAGRRRYRDYFGFAKHLARHAACYVLTARHAGRSRARPWSR